MALRLCGVQLAVAYLYAGCTFRECAYAHMYIHSCIKTTEPRPLHFRTNAASSTPPLLCYDFLLVLLPILLPTRHDPYKTLTLYHCRILFSHGEDADDDYDDGDDDCEDDGEKGDVHDDDDYDDDNDGDDADK